MARLLAIEWNETEARLVVGGGRAGQMAFEQAFTVSLQSPNPADDATQVDAGERIAAALAARGIGRLPTLVALGRGNIELRQLSMPPAPDDELPDLVRFQALREFAAMQEDWPLDFIPLESDPQQPRTVLAAAVAPEQIDDIDSTCHTVGVKPQRILLRPCSAASLFTRAHPGAPNQIRLLIDLLGNEADLTVLDDQTVVFLRSARLPGNPLESADAAEVLQSEVRRTIAAAQNLLAGRRVESLLLFGTSLKHNALRDTLHKQFKLPVTVFDPFENLTLKGELQSNVPDDGDRFAPLLGALLDEVQRTPPAIDFLNPKRPAEQNAQKNAIAAGGLAVAVILLGALLFNFWQKSSLQADIRRLNNELTKLNRQLDKVEKVEGEAGNVEAWVKEDIRWLDELKWLAEKSPPSQDLVLTQMTASPDLRGGAISVTGFARDLDAIAAMEQDLRDDRHDVKGGNTSEDDSLKDYAYRFDSAVYVSKEDE